MPRQDRLDAPGAVHHVVQRGNARGEIFRDERDYNRFLERLGPLLVASRTKCLAWALMPNHLHLLLETGSVPLARLLQRLFTGYAVSFNHRWRRSGHVFQGRYKSLLCEAEPYLLELVRYIHLNPVRGHVCKDLAALGAYLWTGHRTLLGATDIAWQATGEVLRRFGSRPAVTRRAYRQFCADGVGKVPDPRLEGEGLKRLAEGGWQALRTLGKAGEEWADERVLGSDAFVAQALKQAEEHERWRSHVKRTRDSMESVLRLAAKVAKVRVSQLSGSAKPAPVVKARGLACYWLVVRMGYRGVDVAKRLGVSQAAVTKCVERGRELPEAARLGRRHQAGS